VPLDQVLHLPPLAVDFLVEMLRAAIQRSDDVADVDRLAQASVNGRRSVLGDAPRDVLDDVLTSMPLGVRTGRRTVAAGAPLAT
jgi:hypothetical protein